MKRGKFDSLISVSRIRSIQILMGFLFVYLLLMSLEIPLVLRTGLGLESSELDSTISMFTLPNRSPDANEDFANESPALPVTEWKMKEFKKVSGLTFDENAFDSVNKDDFSELHRAARDAFAVGKKILEEIESGNVKAELENRTQNGVQNRTESCPNSVSLSGEEMLKKGKLMVIPCGLTLGSHITVVARPRWAHLERDPKIGLLRDGDDSLMVSQFMMELQGLRAVDGEDPPKILHFNPRIKGDWSGRPVIEQNTCYRMQWGSALRCEGWKSKADEETGKGFFY